ncbi:MAG TPA: NADP-dependent oxidoreductase [Acetobacteraceae bacterium]|nr:NADP-dependent oxidoreductase [Acetobacteraceae bacterium]
MRSKACRVHRFGPPDVIAIEDVDVPEPGEGEVLLRVKAAGVGPWDAWIRSGRSALPQPLPLTLGADLSGEVAAVGPGVASLAVGDAVFGNTNPRFTGAHAEYAIATAAMLARAPTALSDAQAASVPVVAVTAWQALFEQAKVAHGQTVLVHGAAGSVGAYAVQLAHHAGLHVIATAGAADVDEVRRLGADSVLDYRATRFEDVVPSVDAVVDLVGGEAQRRSFAVLKPGGTLVSAVSEPEQAMAARHGVTAMFFLVNVTSAHLARIGDLLGQGVLSPRVGAVLPLAAARTAHEMLEGSRPRPRGRVVLQVAG